MTTSELLEFIRIEHALGMSLDEITLLLIEEGEWDAADVAEAFRALGLPEDAVERYTMKAAGIVTPVVQAAPAVLQRQVLRPQPEAPEVAPVVRHAPPPQPITGPRDMEYVKHAAPMQYIEKPEPKPVPQLARPAALGGQGARPLVRTALSQAGAAPHAARVVRAAPVVHVSKVGQPQPQKATQVIESSPAKETAPIKFTYVPAEQGIQAAQKVAPIHEEVTEKTLQEKEAALIPLRARETVSVVSPLVSPEEKIHTVDHKFEAPKETLRDEKQKEVSSLGFEIAGGGAPVYQPKKPEHVSTPPQEEIVQKPSITPVTPPPTKVEPIAAAPLAAAAFPVIEKAPEQAHVPAPAPLPPPAPTPAPLPTPPPAPLPPPPAPAPLPQQTTLQPIFITMPSFAPEQMQAMQQQYMGMMGQAPVALAPQPAPTIIYNQTITAPAPPPPPIAAAPLPPPLPPEPKKPEPIRFDIGRVRDSRKTDQTTYTGRPSILAAVSGMQPVGSTNIEDVFKSQIGSEAVTELPVEKSTIVHSLKVPQKRTMSGDLVRMQEGIMPEQVVAQTVKTTAIAGVALPDMHPGQSFPQAAFPSTEVPVDDSPIPPPPKKSGKPILLISLSALAILIAVSLGAYYFLFYRLPSAQSLLANATAQLLQGPSVAYDAKLEIQATSTDAEPELLQVDLRATGTVAMRNKTFSDGTHTIVLSMNQVGAPTPISVQFDGNVRVIGNDVYISQNTPTLNTPLEKLLAIGEWAKVPYTDIGLAFGLVGSSTITLGDYTAITPTSLFSSMITTNAPIRVVGSVEKFTKDAREYYRVPIILDAAKAVALDDQLSAYLRGAGASKTSADRAAQLTERFKNVSGELVVDKLLLRPISLTLHANYDPSKIAMQGSVQLVVMFKFVAPRSTKVPDGKTLDELRTLRAGEAGAEEIMARDAPARNMMSILALALKQYAQKAGRFPATLDALITGNYISKDALTPDIANRITYVAYTDMPLQGADGVHCTDKNAHCDFYHMGTTLEYKNSIELHSDADYTSAAISGSDSAGCHNEVDRACYDLVGNLAAPQSDTTNQGASSPTSGATTTSS